MLRPGGNRSTLKKEVIHRKGKWGERPLPRPSPLYHLVKEQSSKEFPHSAREISGLYCITRLRQSEQSSAKGEIDEYKSRRESALPPVQD